jgi:hypothetical protein
VPPAVLFLDFHRLAAANDGARARFGDNHLGAALCAAVSFPYYVGHIYHLF